MSQVDPNQRIKLNLRLVKTNTEFELELKYSTTGSKLIERLLNAQELDLPRVDHNNDPLIYRITCKQNGREIRDDQTLAEAEVKENNTLLIKPEMVAGK